MSQRTKRILFQLSFLAIAFLVIEVAMRVMGHQPGDLKPNWLLFQPVDSLVEDDLFFTNSEGILVADKKRWSQESIYINVDGFRNKEFAEIDSDKKKVLLIGDSYVWGSSAQPMVGNCFADLIRKETNYEIINLGIQAVDPPQYLQLTKKYLPQLKPDFLLVAFYMGNDLMKEDRNSPAGKPFEYVTNAGVITAYDGDKYFSTAKEAYQYFLNEKYFLKKPKNAFECTVSKSAVLSRLYSLRFRIQEKRVYENAVKNSYITKKYLYAIQKISDEAKVPMRFVLIPEVKEADMDSADYSNRYASLLKDSVIGKNWLCPHPIKSFYRDYPDAHLNNEGHRYYADYLKSFLKNYFEQR